MTNIVKKRIKIHKKDYEFFIRKYNQEQLGEFVAHYVSLAEVMNKEHYIKKLVSVLYPTYEESDVSQFPKDIVSALYQRGIEVNPKLEYEHVFNHVQKQFHLAKQTSTHPEPESKYDFMEIISKVDFSELEKKIEYEVQGQQHAISELLAPFIATKHKGWPKDCINTAYLIGPSGVGKTSSVEILANLLGAPCKKLRGSEYMESHTKQNLIGAPTSYVGYQEGGILTNFLAKNPQGFLFFDEIDKAHLDVLTSLHCFLGDGYVTDATGVNYPQDKDGNTIKFKGFVYFTSNTGNSLLETGMGRAIGFGTNMGKTDEEIAKQRIIKILEQQGVETALLNRITQFVMYNPLEPKTLRSILDKQLGEQNESLQYFKVEMTEDAREQLINLGRPKEFGARNIARNMDKCIIWPLCYRYEMQKAFPEKSTVQVDFLRNAFVYKIDKKKIMELSVHQLGF